MMGGKTGVGESYEWLSTVRSMRGWSVWLRSCFPLLQRVGDRQRERCATRDRGPKPQKGDQSHRFDEHLHFGPLVVRKLLIGSEPNHPGQAPIVPARR